MSGKKIARRRFLKQSSAVTAMAVSSFTTPASFAEASGQASTVQSQYQGPLSDLDLHDRQFDALQFSLSSYERIKPAMSFAAKNEREADVWQKRARSKLGIARRLSVQSRPTASENFGEESF